MFDRDPLMSLTVFDLTVLKERKRFELKCFSNLQLFQIVSYISFKGIYIALFKCIIKLIIQSLLFRKALLV